jgi:hypothetical protein
MTGASDLRAIEAACRVYNDTLNGYSQRTALRRAFAEYERVLQERPTSAVAVFPFRAGVERHA